MNLKQLVTILLVLFVLGGESRDHGGKYRVRGGEEHLHEVIVEANAEKRAVFKKGDHLFNNIAKALADIIQDVFTETRLTSFVKANALTSQNAFIVTDKISNKNVTGLFPNIVNDYMEYKNDGLLTTGSDMVSTYDQGQTGNGVNTLQWNKTINELKKMVFELIDKAIEATWLDEQNLQQEKTLLNGMFQNIRKRIAQMINDNEYSDQHAVNAFTSNEKNINDVPKIKAVKQRIEEVLTCLPARIHSWSIEAAMFFKMKLNKRG